MVALLLDRDEQGVAELAIDRLGDVSLAVRVLDQEYLARADHAAFAVADGDFHGAIEVDDVLPARRGMPGIVVGAGRDAKDDAGSRQALGHLAAGAFLGPFHLDVAEMGLSGVVDVAVVDAHLSSSPSILSGKWAGGCGTAPGGGPCGPIGCRASAYRVVISA